MTCFGGPTGGPCDALVVGFDAASGLGSLRLADGRVLGFHAAELLDGTRHVEVGARVSVVVVAAGRGELEARSVSSA